MSAIDEEKKKQADVARAMAEATIAVIDRLTDEQRAIVDALAESATSMPTSELINVLADPSRIAGDVADRLEILRDGGSPMSKRSIDLEKALIYVFVMACVREINVRIPVRSDVKP